MQPEGPGPAWMLGFSLLLGVQLAGTPMCVAVGQAHSRKVAHRGTSPEGAVWLGRGYPISRSVQGRPGDRSLSNRSRPTARTEDPPGRGASLPGGHGL